MTAGKYILFAFFGILPFYVIGQAPTTIKDTTKPLIISSIPATPPAPDTGIHLREQLVVKTTVQKIYDYQRISRGTSPGFRVQIEFGQDRNAITETKSSFVEKYPTIPWYITYKQPYFRLSVGDFRTRLDAVRFLNTAKKDYPAAFIVADKIMPPPL